MAQLLHEVFGGMQVSTQLALSEVKEGTKLAQGRWGRIESVLVSIWWVLVLSSFVMQALSTARRQFWAGTAFFLLVAAGICRVLYNRFYGGQEKARQKINAHNGVMRIDEEGLLEQRQNGEQAFVSWQEILRWKEGKEVFVLTRKKVTLLLGKSQMSEGDAVNLRSMLEANVRAR